MLMEPGDAHFFTGELRGLALLSTTFGDRVVTDKIVAKLFAMNGSKASLKADVLNLLSSRSISLVGHPIYFFGETLRQTIGNWSFNLLMGYHDHGEEQTDPKRMRSARGHSGDGDLILPNAALSYSSILPPDQVLHQLITRGEEICREDPGEFNKEIEYVVFAALSQFALQDKNIASMMLHCVREESPILATRPLRFQTAFVGAMSCLGEILSLDEIQQIIYVDPTLRLSSNQGLLQPLEREVYRRVVERRMRKLTGPLTPLPTAENLEVLLRAGPLDCSLFISWFVEQRSSLADYPLLQSEEGNWSTLRKYFSDVQHLFQLASESFQSLRCSVRVVRTCTSVPKDPFVEAWKIFEMPNAFETLLELDAEIDTREEQARHLSLVTGKSS